MGGYLRQVAEMVKDLVKGAQVLNLQHLGQVLRRGSSAFMRESDRNSAFDIRWRR